MRSFFTVDILFPIQCLICLSLAFCFFRRLPGILILKIIGLGAVLGWVMLSVLDLLLSRPDAQGGLGILFVFPIMSVAAAIFGTSIATVAAFIFRRIVSVR